jgi:hypothetical protein
MEILIQQWGADIEILVQDFNLDLDSDFKILSVDVIDAEEFEDYGGREALDTPWTRKILLDLVREKMAEE